MFKDIGLSIKKLQAKLIHALCTHLIYIDFG